MNKNKILALFDEWNSALQTGCPKKVTTLYENNAILLPTVSNKVRHNHKEIEDYFASFLAKETEVTIEESNVRTFDSFAINSGVYKFTFTDSPTLKARFSFVYRWSGQRWLIVEHHSSAMPE